MNFFEEKVFIPSWSLDQFSVWIWDHLEWLWSFNQLLLQVRAGFVWLGSQRSIEKAKERTTKRHTNGDDSCPFLYTCYVTTCDHDMWQSRCSSIATNYPPEYLQIREFSWEQILCRKGPHECTNRKRMNDCVTWHTFVRCCQEGRNVSWTMVYLPETNTGW